MKKTIYTAFLVLLLTQISTAQKTIRTYFGFGGAYLSFQDTRFSDYQFNKLTVQPELGFILSRDENQFFANLNAHAYKDVHPATDSSGYSSTQFDFRVGYLREINEGFLIGGTWDILDYSFYEQSELENNNNTFITASDFLFSAHYNYEINRDWKLLAGGDLGIFSLIKMAPSFTTNFQQNVVDNGNVSAEDPASRDPLGLKYFDAKFLGQQLYLRTNIEMFYKKHLSMAYLWRMRTIWEQKGYPVTQAQHTLSLRYHFISRSEK